MKVYLTGVNVKKSQIKKPKSKNINLIEVNEPKKLKDKFTKLKEETDALNENDISSEQVQLSIVTSKENTNKSNTENNINNNFISNDDKKKILTDKDFRKIHQKKTENKKNNDIISNVLREDYFEYLMLKEPRYADFDKICDEYQKQIYSSYRRHNNNLLIIARKKSRN